MKIHFKDMQGESLPWYLGKAYVDPLRGYLVVYPIPCNLIVRWARELWFAIRFDAPTVLEQAYCKGYDTAYHKGWEDCIHQIEFESHKKYIIVKPK